jgi:hypothetical protein
MMQFIRSITTKEFGTYSGLLLFPNVTFVHKTIEILHNVWTNVKWFFDFLEQIFKILKTSNFCFFLFWKTPQKTSGFHKITKFIFEKFNKWLFDWFLYFLKILPIYQNRFLNFFRTIVVH